jgi:uncharacterized heparinase superfamily protein
MLFRCGNQAAVSDITIMEGSGNSVQASHEGYASFGIGHQRTVQLKEQSLQLTDEVSGTGEHALDVRFVLGPEWQVSSEMMSGETVVCEIAGPLRLILVCEAGSGLALSVQPAEISREYGAATPTSCILIRTTASLPASIRTRVNWE